MRATFLFILFSHVNEIVWAKQKHIGSSWSDLQHGHSEQSSDQQQGKGPRSPGRSVEKRDVAGNAGTYWSSLQSRNLKSAEDYSDFRKQSHSEDLIPEKVKTSIMPVDDEKKSMSWSDIRKMKSTGPIVKELNPMKLESRKAKRWSEIVEENNAGNGGEDLKPLGTKEMQTISWSEEAENAKATKKGVKPMRTKESETIKKELSPMRAEEKEDSFRRIIEKNQDEDIVALRSSDNSGKGKSRRQKSSFTQINEAESVQTGSTIMNIELEESINKREDTKTTPKELESTSESKLTSILEEKLELDVLEPLRSTHEEGMSADEETMTLQAFRAVEKQQNRSLENEADEKKKKVSSLLTDTFNDMNKRGIKVNIMNPRQKNLRNHIQGCNENEIFFMNKEKMFLVSSEKIVHDITGLAQFETNLWDQIKNQDEIIKTLKARLKSTEKQEQNINYIVETMRASENTRKKELKETKDILRYSREKIRHLENITVQQISKVHDAEEIMEKLKLKLHEKDFVIKDLKNRMEVGEQSEKLKYLKEEIVLCQKEKVSEQQARQKLEKTMDDLNTARLVLQQTGSKTQEDVQLMQKELNDENTLIVLLKTELMNHKKDIQELNKIVLQKDTVVQGLQDQVVNFLDHDYNVLQGCIEKDTQINSQYQALASLKNMTYMQDALTKAKETALKILQKTVYEMVDKISQCSDTAVKGLQAELKALQDEQKPLKREVVELKKALQATKNVLKYKGAEKEHSALRKLLHDQARSLHLCHQETAAQHQELSVKIEKDSRDYQLHNIGCDQSTCQQYCQQNKRTDQLKLRSSDSYPAVDKGAIRPLPQNRATQLQV